MTRMTKISKGTIKMMADLRANAVNGTQAERDALEIRIAIVELSHQAQFDHASAEALINNQIKHGSPSPEFAKWLARAEHTRWPY